MGYVDRGGGSLTTRPIVNGSVVNGRVNDTFVFIFVLGGNWVLCISGNKCYINHSGKYIEINFNLKIPYSYTVYLHV